MFKGAFRKPFQSAFSPSDVAESLGLLENLVLWLAMDEVSNGSSPVQRNDSHSGGLHFTDATDTASGTGVGGVGVAADFDSDRLTRASAAGLQIGDAQWHAMIFGYMDTKPSEACLFTKWGGTGLEYILRYESGVDTFRWYVRRADNGGQAIVNASATVSEGQWYCVEVYHDGVNDKVGIALNGGAFATANLVGGARTSNQLFVVGVRDGESDYWDGRMAKLAINKGALWNEEQRAFLYNGGAGRNYSELS